MQGTPHGIEASQPVNPPLTYLRPRRKILAASLPGKRYLGTLGTAPDPANINHEAKETHKPTAKGFFLTTSLARLVARKCSHTTGFVLSTSQTHIAAPDKRYFNAQSTLTHSPLLQDDSSMISFPSLFRVQRVSSSHYIPLCPVPSPLDRSRPCPAPLLRSEAAQVPSAIFSFC